MAHDTRPTSTNDVKSSIYECVVSRFYDDPAMWSEFLAVTQRSSAKDKCVSLRLLDYMCTTWSAAHRCVLFNGENLHDAYRSCVTSYGKTYFDCFRRSGRFVFEKHGTRVSTTLGQLLFFKEAIPRGFIVYARAHNREIRNDMLGGKKKYAYIKKKDVSVCYMGDDGSGARAGAEEKVSDHATGKNVVRVAPVKWHAQSRA